MTRSTRALVGYWDKQAPSYDTKMTGAERRLFPDSRQWVCSRARGETLEVGIGTGANLTHYPDDVALTGIDWSPAMLDLARRQAERLRRRVALHQGDAAALPFPAESFDTVVSTFALCCIPDERGALTEALRVLRPGGRLILADHIVASFWPLRAVQHVADLVAVPLHGEHFTRRPLATVRELSVTLKETERRKMGAIEHVHARKPA
ncbi:MAG: class I SAM-dependent methyltransferase [Ornithinimicrobium sp.]|jgi:ubiquinone/menaquinone biosynthesis C-methylase UbiE|uniref:class I SAM-dependent methyltransferase n=1 Tax=Ornithinimicrobium sp. TaxID=1977084 RepID=UPI003D9B116B